MEHLRLFTLLSNINSVYERCTHLVENCILKVDLNKLFLCKQIQLTETREDQML